MAALELRVSVERAEVFAHELGEILSGYDIASGDVDAIADALTSCLRLYPEQHLENMSESDLSALRRKINRIQCKKYLA